MICRAHVFAVLGQIEMWAKLRSGGVSVNVKVKVRIHVDANATNPKADMRLRDLDQKRHLSCVDEFALIVFVMC